MQNSPFEVFQSCELIGQVLSASYSPQLSQPIFGMCLFLISGEFGELKIRVCSMFVV